MQALRDEGHDPDEYLFEINFTKGKPAKPVASSKVTKEAEKNEEKQEEEPESVPEEKTEEIAKEEPTDVAEPIEEDELIIKDDIDNDCFEEVDRIGDVEKLVRKFEDS